MIKTTDLMLGNYVVCRVGGKDSEKRSIPMKVVALFDDCAYLDFDGNEGDVWEEYDKDLFGIEITEELLVKCGFKEEKNYVSKSVIYNHKGVVLAVKSGVAKLQYKQEYLIGGIRFLHQLQNAYHLLTGKDLEIKL